MGVVGTPVIFVIMGLLIGFMVLSYLTDELNREGGTRNLLKLFFMGTVLYLIFTAGT